MPPRLDYGKRPSPKLAAVGRVTEAASDATATMFGLNKRVPRVRAIEIPRIEPNPDQPRKHFPAEAHDGLKVSMSRFGLIQPITVRPLDSDETRFMIVAGERRFRAARDLGWADIDAIVTGGEQADALALVENMLRVDLYAIEMVEHLRRLRDTHGMRQKDLAEAIGISQSLMSRLLAILDLPQEVRQDCLENRPDIGRSILMEIAQIEGAALQAQAWEYIKQGKTVRAFREWLEAKNGADTEGDAGATDDAMMRKRVGGKVKRIAKEVGLVISNQRWLDQKARDELARLRDSIDALLKGP